MASAALLTDMKAQMLKEEPDKEFAYLIKNIEVKDAHGNNTWKKERLKLPYNTFIESIKYTENIAKVGACIVQLCIVPDNVSSCITCVSVPSTFFKKMQKGMQQKC